MESLGIDLELLWGFTWALVSLGIFGLLGIIIRGLTSDIKHLQMDIKRIEKEYTLKSDFLRELQELKDLINKVYDKLMSK